MKFSPILALFLISAPILTVTAEQAKDGNSNAPYTWTTDHMHVGVRWQPFASRPGNNSFDAQRPILANESSYVQFWVSWAAMEPTERNLDYIKFPSPSLKAIEAAVATCNERGQKVEFVFFHTPKWASESGESGGWKPKDGLFEDYATRLSTHFKGRVHAYQLSHEANLEGLMKGATMDFLIEEILLGGAKAIKAVYDTEPSEPVIVSTSGCSPCETCTTREGLEGTGGWAVSQFYDQLIANSELMNTVDALNMNVSDQNDGYGNMDGSYVPSVWGNYDLAREKLDTANLYSKAILASESWISWDDGGAANDVDGDGNKTEVDAYHKTVTIIGKCMERGLNTINFPWSDNSSGWAMGLTKRRDYNGRVKTEKPDIVIPANDGGPDIVTQKVILRGRDDTFTIDEPEGNIFTVEDYIDPSDPNHLHYYIWRWYAQLSGGADEVIRHAIAGETGNDIAVTGIGFTGDERYRIASYNRTKQKFTVLIYSNGAAGDLWAKMKLPATIQTGKHYNNDASKEDFRGEGFADGEVYHARITTKDISLKDGSDINPSISITDAQTVENGLLSLTIPVMNKFTTIEFIKGDPKAGQPKITVIGEKMVSRMDVSKDQVITEEEYVGFWDKQFATSDTDADGVLTIEEFPFEQALSKADIDKSSTLSKEEYLSIYQNQFTGLDKDKDGQITAADKK